MAELLSSPSPSSSHSPPPEQEEQLVGLEARVFADKWSPEATGIIEVVRGFGTLRAVEIRIHANQPGPRVRVAFHQQWELTKGGEL